MPSSTPRASSLRTWRPSLWPRRTILNYAARAEAARLTLGLLVRPGEIDRIAPALEVAVGHWKVEWLKKTAEELHRKAGQDYDLARYLRELQERYAVPKEGFEEAAARLQSLFDGWSERWESVDAVRADAWTGEVTRRYVLEKAGARGPQTRSDKEIRFSSDRAEDSFPDPIEAEHRMVDSDAYQLYRTVVPYDSDYGRSEGWIFGWALTLMVSAFGIVCAMQEPGFVSSLIWQLGTFGGFLIAAPFLGRAIAQAGVRRIYGLSWGGFNRRRGMAEASEELGAKARRYSLLGHIARYALLPAAALTGFLFFVDPEALARWGGPMLAQLPISMGVVVAAMTLLGAVLFLFLLGFGAGARRSQRLAELLMEKLRLGGVQRPGGI